MKQILFAVTLALAACGQSSSSPSTSSSELGTAAPLPPPPPPMVRKAATIGALGAATTPPEPTRAQFDARSCAAAAPFDLGPTTSALGDLAFRTSGGGLAAWIGKRGTLSVRAIDRAGKPTGAAHDIAVPGGAVVRDVRALDKLGLVFVARTDFSGPSPILQVFAQVVGLDGAPVGALQQLEVGDRGMIDSISPGAASGAILWAGPTPATHVATGRILWIAVGADGALSEHITDIPDPAPGDRAVARFGFDGGHSTVWIGAGTAVLVDGEVAKPGPAVPAPDRGIAFVISVTGNQLDILPSDAGAALPKIAATALPAIDAAMSAKLAWSGDQEFLLYAGGGIAHVIPLPCGAR